MNKIILFVILILDACSPKLRADVSIAGKTFESKQDHLYSGNRFIFNKDSTFIFIGHGPSVFLSKGVWSYDSLNREVLVKSKPPAGKYLTTIDTFWIDLSQKKVKVTSNKQLIFDNVAYSLQRSE